MSGSGWGKQFQKTVKKMLESPTIDKKEKIFEIQAIRKMCDREEDKLRVLPTFSGAGPSTISGSSVQGNIGQETNEGVTIALGIGPQNISLLLPQFQSSRSLVPPDYPSPDSLAVQKLCPNCGHATKFTCSF